MANVDGGSFRQVFMHVAETEEANGTAVECVDGVLGAYTVLTMHIEGVNGDTLTFEGTIDGTNWIAIQATNLNDGTAATTATADGLYRITVIGLYKVRARISTGGSGSVTVTAYAVA